MDEKSRMRFSNFQSDNPKPVLSQVEGSKTCGEQRRTIQNPKWVGYFAFVIALTVCGAVAEAQQPKKLSRIGYLSNTSPTAESARSEAVGKRLRELGYVEGQNLSIDYRYGEGNFERAPKLAAELVGLNCDVIVVFGGYPWIRAVMDATKTIPIVMTGGGVDPVDSGVIKSLARPGGNVTGITNLSTDLARLYHPQAVFSISLN